MDMKPEDSIFFDPMAINDPDRESCVKTRKLELPFAQPSKASEIRKKLLTLITEEDKIKKINSLSDEQILKIGEKLGLDKKAGI